MGSNGTPLIDTVVSVISPPVTIRAVCVKGSACLYLSVHFHIDCFIRDVHGALGCSTYPEADKENATYTCALCTYVFSFTGEKVRCFVCVVFLTCVCV